MKRNAPQCLRLVLLLVVLLTAAPTRAFDTWSFWGGETHEIKLITEPLWQFGVKQDRIKRIADGANSQDLLGSPNFEGSPQNHFDDNKITKGGEYVKERMNTAMILAREAWKTPAPAVIDKETWVGRALYALGQGFHTAHDFYCHTNYLEVLLRNKRPLVPVDYTKIPPEVHSGHFYWYNKAYNEGTTMPAVPDSLVNDRERVDMEQMPTDPFVMDLVKKRHLMISWMTNVDMSGIHSDEEFQRRVQNPTYDGALAYVTNNRPLLHFECAKDNPKSLQGRIITPNGETLYTQALKLARAATVQQWLLFEKMIREDSDQARIAAWNLATLKGRPFPKVKILSIKPKTPIALKDKITGIAKIQLMNVDALFADNTKPCKLQIKVAGTLSKGFQRGEYTVGQETGGVGDGAYDIPLDKLYLLAPDERGEVTLKLEITLADDPTPYAEFGTAPLTVEMSTPASIPPGTPTWRLKKVDVDPHKIAEIAPESYVISVSANRMLGEIHDPNGQSNDGPKLQASATFGGEVPTVLRPGDKFDQTMTMKAGPEKNISSLGNKLSPHARAVNGYVRATGLQVTRTPADAIQGAGSFSDRMRGDGLQSGESTGRVFIAEQQITYHIEVPKALTIRDRSEFSFRRHAGIGNVSAGVGGSLAEFHYVADVASAANQAGGNAPGTGDAGPIVVGGPSGGASGATSPKPPPGQSGTTPPPGSSVTTVAGDVAVRSAASGTLDVKAGAALPAGEAVEIRTGTSGTISVRLPSGATLMVMPGSVVRIEANGRVVLSEGSVNGDTGTQSGGRKIEVITPVAECTDDGTRFTVYHDPIKSVTTVAVAEGSVRVRPTNSGAAARRVGAGERIEVLGPDKAAKASATPASLEAKPFLQGISAKVSFSALKPGYINGDEFSAAGLRLTASKGRLHVLPTQSPAMVMPAGQAQVLAVEGDRITEFALEFNPPVKSFTLTLPGLRGGASFPTYSITAFNPAGASVDMVGQEHWIPTVPEPARITLNKGMMSRAVISVDNRFGNTAWATYNCLPLVEIELQR